jgi:hypothetical protein
LRLRPLPVALWLGAAFAVLLAVVVINRFRNGQLLLSGIQLLLGLIVLRGLILDLLLLGPDPPRNLVLSGDGGLTLESRSGLREVQTAAATLVWGRCLLLVLEGGNGPRVRLLLGPGNIPASQLAALRREWLRPRRGLSGPLA